MSWPDNKENSIERQTAGPEKDRKSTPPLDKTIFDYDYKVPLFLQAVLYYESSKGKYRNAIHSEILHSQCRKNNSKCLIFDQLENCILSVRLFERKPFFERKPL